MPMLAVMRHLSLIDTNRLTAVVTVFGEHCVETVQTIRFTIAHNVPLATQLFVTLETSKVFHVPCTSLGLRTFISKDYLRWRKRKKKEKEEITINIRFRDKNVCGYKTIEFVPSRVVSIIVVITESPKRYSHFVSPYGAWLRFMCAT